MDWPTDLEQLWTRDLSRFSGWLGSSTFLAIADNQVVIEVEIFQGEHELIRDNKLRSFRRPCSSQGRSIKATFDVAVGSIVRATVKDKAINKGLWMIIISSVSPTRTSSIRLWTRSGMLKLMRRTQGEYILKR